MEENKKEFVCTTADLTCLFEVTKQTIADWCKKGMPKLRHGVFSVRSVVLWWQTNICTGPEDKDETIVALKAQKLKEEVEHWRTKNAKARGELATRAEFERNEAHRMAGIRGSLMSLPGRLSLALEQKDRETIRQAIKREVFTMLDNFRRKKSYLADGCELMPEDDDSPTPIKKPTKRKPAKKKKVKK